MQGFSTLPCYNDNCNQSTGDQSQAPSGSYRCSVISVNGKWNGITQDNGNAIGTEIPRTRTIQQIIQYSSHSINLTKLTAHQRQSYGTNTIAPC
jgi:hypothetical protein